MSVFLYFIIEIIFKTTNNIITYIIEVSYLTYMFFDKLSHYAFQIAYWGKA